MTAPSTISTTTGARLGCCVVRSEAMATCSSVAVDKGGTLAFELAPAAGAVVGDDVSEHCFEGRRVHGLALIDRDHAAGFVVVAGGDDVFGVRDDGAVVQEDIDVVLGGQQSAHVAVQDEV